MAPPFAMSRTLMSGSPYRVTVNGVEFPTDSVALPLISEHARHASPAERVLEALWYEERLDEVEGAYRLPSAELYRLDRAEAGALGFPTEIAPLQVELRTSGYAGASNFSVQAVLHHSEVGVLDPQARVGPFVRFGERFELVPEAALPLLSLIDEQKPEAIAQQLLLIAEIRRAAAQCSAQLDGYLAGQEIEVPEAVGIEVHAEDPSHIQLRPTLVGVDMDDVPGFATGPTRAAYTKIDGPKRRRVVLNAEARQAADDVKRREEITGADVPRFFDNPEAYLPDSIDLSRFSLRVRGLVPRRYNSQPYVRLQPTEKRDWFAFDVSVELADLSLPHQAPNDDASSADAQTASSASADEPPGSPESGEPELPPSITPAQYADLCRQVTESGEPYVLHGESWIEIQPEVAERYLSAWETAEDDGRGGRALKAEKLPLVLDVISNLEELEFNETAASSIVLPNLPDYQLPASLEAELMPHQLIGYRWMRFLHENRYGGLLADDMGLGKTVQVISLFAHLADAGQLQPALIVLPISLMENWRRELSRFCPRIKRIYAHQGAERLRSAEAISQWEVVLTSYETLRRDQLLLGQVDWSVIACDEAQKVKNPTSQATSAVKGMKAKLRLALTGTPVENGLSELWCIVDWAQPGKLGSQREFRENYERPMQRADDEGRNEIAFRLQHQLTPHYIRRVKQDVLQLPERNDTPLEQTTVSMGPRQQHLYAGVLAQVRSGDMIPIQGLQHLIAVASHPELFEESSRSITDLVGECPKLRRSLELVEEIRDRDEKVVIFTRYRRMQQILQAALADRFGIHAAILNGQVAGGRRMGFVDEFNHAPGFGALILSPEAAGVGLNIVGANHVIHYTRLWNPAKENQATDRVHRIGQTRPVYVHYPIVGGGELPTVEERLHALLEEKQALARDVIRPRESLSVEKELFEIFGMPEAT